MPTSDLERIYNASRAVAIRLYGNIKSIKDLTPFSTSKFTLITNGLAVSITNPFYKGHVYIIEDEWQNLRIFFAPRERNPLYLTTSLDYLKIFTQLLKPGEVK